MAVYLVSVNRLAAARSRLAAVAEGNPPAAPTTETPAEAPQAAPSSTTRPGRKRRRKAKADAAADDAAEKKSEKGEVQEKRRSGAGVVRASEADDRDVTASVEGLLQLPADQVGALLASCDDPTRKVLLALIYRLAAVEDELRDMSAKVRSSGFRAVQSATFRASRPSSAGADDKGGLLEKVFQKNIALRKEGAGGA